MNRELSIDTSEVASTALSSEARCNACGRETYPVDVPTRQDGMHYGNQLTLVEIAPDSDTKKHFEISRKDWLSIVRIVAAGDYLDAREIARMKDPQPGYEVSDDIWDDMDIALIRILEWLDRLRADRIYLSASVVRIRDEHNYMDSNTTFLDLQQWSNDSELDSDVLYRFRNFAMCRGGFRIDRVSSPDTHSIDSPISPGESGATANTASNMQDQDPENPDDDFNFDDDEFELEGDSDTCTCPKAGSGDTKPPSTPTHELVSAEKSENLMDRLVNTESFSESEREYLRVQALKKENPDYGTFLKDEEVIELFPEAAASYHVDDIRRALMMIRMILDYGESAFTYDGGLAVLDLLWCILEQDDFWFEGSWSVNNPVARREKARVRAAQTTSVDFDDDDFALDEEPIDAPPPINTLTSGGSGCRVAVDFEGSSL